MDKFPRSKYKFIIPAVHFLLSFIFERRILIFNLDKDIIATIAKSDIISDSMERVEGYVLAKIFAGIFIWLFWQLIFFAAENIKETYVKVFLAVTVTGGVLMAFMWPNSLLASEDNLITYAYALRLWPEYWHSAYTSYIYTACLMALPWSCSIGLFQWIAFMSSLGYIYKRMKECEKLPAKGRFFIFIIFLMPGIFTLMTNSYRTEIYAILCIYYVSRIIFDMLDERKASSGGLFTFMLISGLVSVWRSEGAILGLLGFGIYLLFVQRYKVGKVILLSASMVLVFGITLLPQKLGDIKYYGKDYSFINSFVNLQNILNTDGANLSYEGNENDFAAFEAVTPIPILKKYGMDGYRRYNYANGRKDINQSLADDDVSAAYMKAYYNLLLHNPGIYFKTQATMLANILMIKPGYYIAGYDADIEDDLDPWKLEIWDIGREDIGRTSAFESAPRVKAYSLVKGIFDSISKLFTKSHLYTLLLLFITMAEVFIFIKEVIRAVMKKPNLLGFAGLALVLLLQAMAIVLVLPYAALVYLHAYYYTSMVLVLVYILFLVNGRKTEK